MTKLSVKIAYTSIIVYLKSIIMRTDTIKATLKCRMTFAETDEKKKEVKDNACVGFKNMINEAEKQKKSECYDFILRKSKGFLNVRAKLLLIRVDNKIKKIKKMVEKEIENLKK